MIKRGPADYWRVIGSGRTYTDPDFRAGPDGIFWPQYPRTGGSSLASRANSLVWARPKDRYSSVSLYGNSIGSFDII